VLTVTPNLERGALAISRYGARLRSGWDHADQITSLAPNQITSLRRLALGLVKVLDIRDNRHPSQLRDVEQARAIAVVKWEQVFRFDLGVGPA